MRATTISIIIPVYNEATHIEPLFCELINIKKHCEILFIDGGSKDNTREKIIENGFSVLPSHKKGRAAQMNAGANQATGDILWFLHADSKLPIHALDEIRAAICNGYNAGCFKIKFDSSHFLMNLIGVFSNLRVKTRGIAFGDQGIFIEKTFFRDLGGFRDIPIMEDYDLSLKIRKTGVKLCQINDSILTSERRFVANGRFKTMVRMQYLQHLYRKGTGIDQIAEMYQ